MKKYAALLRGVNVGGNNKIEMAKLKEAFLEGGFFDVSTYINSGNVIFSSDKNSEIELKVKCENLIKDKFGLSIAVAVISAADLTEALKNAPKWWGGDAGFKHNAFFVILPARTEDIIKAVGPIKPEYEKADSFGQVIFWSAPIKTFSRTRWSNFVSTSPLSSVLTIRNSNTAKKLAQLMEQ